jgi:hypothetical protein
MLRDNYSMNDLPINKFMDPERELFSLIFAVVLSVKCIVVNLTPIKSSV